MCSSSDGKREGGRNPLPPALLNSGVFCTEADSPTNGPDLIHWSPIFCAGRSCEPCGNGRGFIMLRSDDWDGDGGCSDGDFFFDARTTSLGISLGQSLKLTR